ncbi:MAG TPA: hypothetical protein VFF69_00560 [Phycisphaerales bacterium]|nr:hypothetical protein [Phycisphaerales bacterium]
MLELKRISPESIPRAISKAERYRLLNEPRPAESICRDILAIEPRRQEVLRILILALTDQFKTMGVKREEPERVIPHLEDEYSRQYYSGVILERWAKSLLDAGNRGPSIYDLFRQAMAAYERAMPLAAGGDEDAVLRWNTCVRIIARNRLAPTESGETDGEVLEHFDDEVPFR